MINIVNDRVLIVIDDVVLIEMFYIADEFVWILNSKEIVINNDCDFYFELEKIMNNNYIFQDGIASVKSNEILVWLSDQYCDISNEEDVNRVNRLVIKRKNDCFLISVINPYLDNLNINKKSYMISFSPLFNGYFSRNTDSGISLQDDFCLMYHKLVDKMRYVLK